MKTFILIFGVLVPFAAVANELPAKFAEGSINKAGQITLTPAFTPDGLTAYFPQSDCAQIGPCPQTLQISQKIGGVWQKSRPVSLPQAGRVDWPSVSPDGKHLLFSWSAKREKYSNLSVREDFDLYRLDLTNKDAVPEPLDLVYGELADLNRPRHGAVATLRYVHNETAPQLTHAGDLYFWSERLDAVGERDIFIAERQADGKLAPAKALGTPINSPLRDTYGWVSPEGGLMLLSYPDRGGSGGSDIFVSRKLDGSWSEPQNLGPSLNSAAADFGARFTPDKQNLVFTSTRDNQALQVFSLPTRILIEDGTLTEADLRR